MNEERVADLLDRLVGQAQVGPPPVERVVEAGRRRRRVRLGIQLVGAAAAVALVVAGGVVLRPVLSNNGSASTPPSSTSGVNHAIPGRPPTPEQLVGDWLMSVRPVHGPPSSTVGSKGRLTLTFRLPSSGLQWGGDDGCNSWGGQVRLGTGGAFSAPDPYSTLVGCLDKTGFSAVTVIRHARQVRLQDGRLSFYDGANHLLGTFTRTSAGH
jgi:hypothetical protein